MADRSCDSGVAPLAAVSAIRAYQALVQRREGLRARPGSTCRCCWWCGASAEIASAVVKRIGEHGGFSVLPVANALAPITEMSAHWRACSGFMAPISLSGHHLARS